MFASHSVLLMLLPVTLTNIDLSAPVVYQLLSL